MKQKQRKSTKNTKGNRKVVATIYQGGVFKIPDNLDLEDKSVVSEWFVKWNILYINYADGKKENIEPYMDYQDDYKFPNETLIEDEDRHSALAAIYCEDEDED